MKNKYGINPSCTSCRNYPYKACTLCDKNGKYVGYDPVDSVWKRRIAELQKENALLIKQLSNKNEKSKR